jgi:hypothetical protein
MELTVKMIATRIADYLHQANVFVTGLMGDKG